MKNNTYYVRVLTNNDKFIGLNANKLKSLEDLIPDDNLVNEHLIAQSEIIRREVKKYDPIEISILHQRMIEIYK